MTAGRADGRPRGIVLGAGRERKGDPIDLAVGVVLQAKVGDRVRRGQPLAVLHANDEARLDEAERVLRSAIDVSAAAVERAAAHPGAAQEHRLGLG